MMDHMIDTLFPDPKQPELTRRRQRAIRRAQLRANHRAKLAVEAMNAPDELRKVAACPRCRAWFETVEARNAHRAEEHAVGAARIARIGGLAADEIEDIASVGAELHAAQGATP